MTEQLCSILHSHTKNALVKVSVRGIFVAEEAFRHLHTNVCSIVLDHFPLHFIAVAI
jgi:hypothetical protein